jgi:hypothetical protein
LDGNAVEAEIKQLRYEHDRRVYGCSDLPTQLAKERADARLAALDSSIKPLEERQVDVSGIVSLPFRK